MGYCIVLYALSQISVSVHAVFCKSHFEKDRKKDLCLVCIFFMIVIFINVSDTAGVAVLLNL